MRKALLAWLLCLCLLLAGSARPLFAYASPDDENDEEYTEEYEEEYDGADGSDADAQDDTNEVEQKYQGSIDELNDKLEQLAQEQKEIESNIASVKSEKDRAIAEKNAIESLISNALGQIATLEERIQMLKDGIAEIEGDIEKKLAAIDKKQAEIDKNYETLRKRLRAMYVQDNTTTLGLILGADSFSDLLTRVEYVRRIAEHDRQLLATLTEQREDLEAEKAALEDDIAKLEETRAAVESDQAATQEQKNRLDVDRQKAQLQVQDIEQMQREYEADREKNKKLQDAAKAELDRILKEIEWSKNAYAGGAMAWPLPGYTSVTSEFGPRFGGSDYHTGIDLSGSGVYGKNIVAANDGTIVVANWAWTQGYGYGIYVVVDHGVDQNGNSISTLYGHCSSISVQVGDTVKRGQAIAQVGSTGWSTGPHLHFEVRINQKATNPRPYIFG